MRREVQQKKNRVNYKNQQQYQVEYQEDKTTIERSRIKKLKILWKNHVQVNA